MTVGQNKLERMFSAKVKTPRSLSVEGKVGDYPIGTPSKDTLA
jgi:hypothetical protein